jgi:hypothetical protein
MDCLRAAAGGVPGEAEETVELDDGAPFGDGRPPVQQGLAMVSGQRRPA